MVKRKNTFDKTYNNFSQPPSQSYGPVKGATSARGVARGVEAREFRQIGHVGCSRSHGSTHLRWKTWPQSGKSLSVSLSL